MANEIAMQRIHDLVVKAYEQCRFTDLAIEFQGEVREVHKVIICGQSAVFNAMCTRGFREAESSLISLSNDADLDVLQFNCLVDYFYHGVYCAFPGADVDDFRRDSPTSHSSRYLQPPNSLHRSSSVPSNRGNYLAAPESHWATYCRPRSTRRATTSPNAHNRSEYNSTAYDFRGNPLSAKFHAQMYATADRYDVSDLADYAASLYSRSIETSFKEFCDSAVTVYTSTPNTDRGLRDVVAGYMRRNVGNIRGDEDRRRLRGVVESLPEFPADVFEQWSLY